MKIRELSAGDEGQDGKGVAKAVRAAGDLTPLRNAIISTRVPLVLVIGASTKRDRSKDG